MNCEGEQPIFEANKDFQITEYDTIPMMILKDVLIRKGDETPIMQSEISGAAGGAAVVGIGNVLGSVLKFGCNYLLQVGFGATLYGLYSVCLSMVMLVSSLCNLGLSDTTIRYTAIYWSRGQKSALNGLLIFCTLIASVTGLLGALCILLFSPLLASIKREPELTPLMQLMAPMVPLLCMQTVWFSALQGLKRFRCRVLSERILAPIVLLLLALLFFFLSPSIFNVASATIVSTITGTCVSAYFLYQAVVPTMRRGLKKYEIREWMNFATFNFLTSVTEVILESIDTLLLVLLAVKDLQIGQYSAAIKISDFIAMPLFSLNTMFAPTIAELYSRGERQKLAILYQVVNKWTITLSLPLFFIAALFCKSLLQLSGPSFVSAWPLLIVSAIGSMINAATGSVGYMLLMTGYQKISFFNSILSVILNIILGILLIPKFGAMGTALGTMITLILMNVIRLFEIRFLLNLYPYNWHTLKPLGAACLSALLVGGSLQILRNASLLVHLFFIPVFMVSYGGFLFLFSVSPEDAIVLDGLKKKFLQKK
jgi:O-antigen/teichoic acid export membrane protein